MCVCIYLCMYRCMYVYACGSVYIMCTYVFVYQRVRLVACYSVSDLLGRSKLGNRRFRFVPILDPIPRWLEDRSMGWSVGQYRFVQWRPDGVSVPKPCHFMWVFVLMSFPYLPLLFVLFHVTIRCILQCDYLYHFMRHYWLFTLVT